MNGTAAGLIGGQVSCQLAAEGVGERRGAVAGFARRDRTDETEYRILFEPANHVGSGLRLRHRLGKPRHHLRAQAPPIDRNQEKRERFLEPVGTLPFTDQRIVK